MTADVIVARSGRSHTINGRGGNDRICTGSGDDWILGGSGSDRIDAGGGTDRLEGGNGSDLLLAGGGADLVLGNRGNDRIGAGGGNGDFADAGLGDDLVSGGTGSEDRVIGGVGNDRLSGGAGSGDILRGDHGKDLFDGGAGEHDVASFAVSGFDGPIVGGQGVIVDLNAGSATQDGMDRLVGIEDIIGTAFSDELRGNGAENVLYGGGGNDHLNGVGPRDRAVGAAGSDTCVGAEFTESCGPETRRDRLAVEVAVAGGSSGGSLAIVPRQPEPIPGTPIGTFPRDMSIEVGFAGNGWSVIGGPELFAGEGCAAGPVISCPISGEPDAVLVSGSSGNDMLVLNDSLPGTVTGILYGGAGSDHLRGGPGDDSLNGGGRDSSSKDDVLDGSGGDDALANGAVLLGGNGSDLLIGSPCSDQHLEGGPGSDSASFARSSPRLGVQVRVGGIAVSPRHKFGSRLIPAGCSLAGAQPTLIGRSIENIEGSPEDDVLMGNGAANILLGRGGDDRILGDGGGDFLVGGTGRDIIAGGQGNDRIYAHDGRRDQRLTCGLKGVRQDVARVDPTDPVAVGCRTLP
jgi:Ca2+-binding RTX toxin-like protein